MAVLKRHLTHIGNKGRGHAASGITIHKGKGGQGFSMPSDPTIQDYGKQTPMANSPSPDMQGMDDSDEG